MDTPQPNDPALEALKEVNHEERSFWRKDVVVMLVLLVIAAFVGGYFYVQNGRLHHDPSPPGRQASEAGTL